MRPNWLTTASKDVSGSGIASARASIHSIAVDLRRATSSISGLASSPTTDPSGPTRSATASVSAPVPHATSSTRLPGLTAAASATTGPHWAKSAGTKNSS